MWLKLVNDDNRSIRINTAMISAYYTHEDGKNTAIDYMDVCYLVKQTIEEIDDALINPANRLRLIKTW